MKILRTTLLIIFGFLAVGYLALSAYALWPVKEFPVSEFTSASDQFIQVQGYNLRYVEHGQIGDPPLVLVHGFAGSVYTWRKLIPLLEDRYHIFALDLPGFGLSEKPIDFDYGYESQGRVVAGFIDQLGLENITLAGHSMGGNIVTHASFMGNDIVRLILLDPGIIDDGNPEFLKYLFFPLTRISAKLFRNTDFRMASFESSYFRPELITEADIEANMLASKTEGFVDSLVTMLRNYDDPKEFPLMADISQPVLLLWGEFDKGNPPANGKTILTQLQDGELRIIEDSGHYIHEEQPEQTAEFIDRFIGGRF
jgi:pimeloyl-ACP methyl ester carboxylesterase